MPKFASRFRGSARSTKGGSKKRKYASRKKYKPRAAPRRRLPAVKANECTVKYAVAVADPFNNFAHGACVPTYPSMPSQKATAVISGTVKVATSNQALKYAFVACSPCLANNLTQVVTSRQELANKFIDFRTPRGVGANDYKTQGYVCAQLPCNDVQLTDGTSDYSPSFSGRIVSAGLRIRYIGTEKNNGGLIYGLSKGNHETVQERTMTEWTVDQGVVKIRPSYEWTTITCMGSHRDELEYGVFRNTNSTDHYRQMCYPLSGGRAVDNGGVAFDATHGAPIMGFQIDAATSDAQFEWEYIIHTEYIGKNTDRVKSANKTAPGGADLVVEAKQNARTDRNQDSNPVPSVVESLVESTAAEGKIVAKELLHHAGGEVKRAAIGAMATAGAAAGMYVQRQFGPAPQHVYIR